MIRTAKIVKIILNKVAFPKMLYLCRRYAVPKGSKGNQVQILDSSRCCKLFTLSTMPLKTMFFGKALSPKE